MGFSSTHRYLGFSALSIEVFAISTMCAFSIFVKTWQAVA